MEENIIELIKSLDPNVNTNDLKYSNHPSNLKYLISLCKFRLEMYDKKNSEYAGFLNKKNQHYTYLDNFGVENIKMVSTNNQIYFFDEDFTKIYLIIDNLKKEIKRI